MKTYLDCIPCFFRQALAAARMSTDDALIQRRVLSSISSIIPELSLDVTPPEIGQQVYRIVSEITGNNDPYLTTKRSANMSAMALYGRMRDIVDHSDEALETACKLAIAGNAIDLGARDEYGCIHSMIEESVGYQLDQGHYRNFKECVDKSSLVLYLGDNAGEIVFDRILIEQILNMKKSKIVFAVRDKPIINDVTFDDALQVGLEDVATAISNGSDAPATILSQCSSEMLDYYNAADLIVSKGQGNYESLSGRPENIFFLLKIKCPVIARDTGYDLDSLVLI